MPALVEAVANYPIHAPAALASFGRDAERGVPAALRAMEQALSENLKDESMFVRALQIRDGVEAALAAAYGVEKGENVLVTLERVKAVTKAEYKESLPQIAEKLKAAALVDVVLERR